MAVLKTAINPIKTTGNFHGTTSKNDTEILINEKLFKPGCGIVNSTINHTSRKSNG